MLRKIHPIAGIIGALTILMFWTSTAYSELFGTPDTIAATKAMILNGMVVLIPSMAIVSASGMSMGRARRDAPARAKKRRMALIAANGMLILLPAAVYLEAKASAGTFDTAFFAVQTLELMTGATNLILMGFSIRDGRAMAARRRQSTS